MTTGAPRLDRFDTAGFRRIAVLRANALGDLLFAWPALETLRHAAPSAEIVLLGKRLHAEVMAGRPAPVDRVEVLPPVPGVSVEPEADVDREAEAAFVARMRAEDFDLALQLHGGGRFSNPFVRRLGARLTVGLRAPDAEPLDVDLPYVYYQPEVARYLEVLGLLGIPPYRWEARFPVTARDRAELAPFEPAAPLVAVHPGASDARRRWSPERFAEVIDRLAASGVNVVLTGAGGDADPVKRVSDAARSSPLDTCGRLSVGGLAALYERCDVVISNDTGPLHLAAAVGARTVGLFWCGNLLNGGPATRRMHRPQVSWTLHCPLCGADCTRDLYPFRRGGPPCAHEVSFVDDISVPEVVAAVGDLLRETTAERLGARNDDARKNYL